MYSASPEGGCSGAVGGPTINKSDVRTQICGPGQVKRRSSVRQTSEWICGGRGRAVGMGTGQSSRCSEKLAGGEGWPRVAVEGPRQVVSEFRKVDESSTDSRGLADPDPLPVPPAGLSGAPPAVGWRSRGRHGGGREGGRLPSVRGSGVPAILRYSGQSSNMNSRRSERFSPFCALFRMVRSGWFPQSSTPYLCVGGVG